MLTLWTLNKFWIDINTYFMNTEICKECQTRIDDIKSRNKFPLYSHILSKIAFKL